MLPSRIILSNHTTHAPTLTDPFDERVDYNSFAAYYPMVDINAHPDRFLRCLRALSRSPRFVHRMRKGLKEARRRLSYSSPAPGDRGSTLTRGGAGSAGALEELLVSVATPNRHTPRRMVGKNLLNTATDPLPLAEPRKGRNAVDLREACAALG